MKDQGFSMIEVLVSVTLALIVSSSVLMMLLADTATSRTTPEVVDMQQRARSAQELIMRDVYQAGAGMYLGPAVGSLQQSFAAILPRRAGLSNADAYNVARADAITLLYVPSTMTQASLQAALTPGVNLRLQSWPNCGTDPVCGLSNGASVLVFDRLEHFDAFTVTDVFTDSVRLRSWQATHAPFSYPAGAMVAELQWHTYYFDSVARQLRHFDGYQTDTPVIDDVVGLNFEYVGDTVPPAVPRPWLGAANCLFDASGAYRAGLSTLAGDGGTLALLPLELFRDGPWCGDGENRFDADLLRIRKVKVTLRLQAGNEMMRGQSAEFAVAGRSRSAARSLPDYTLTFDVAPRNVGLSR